VTSLDPTLPEMRRALIEKHLTSPHITAEQYLAEKRAELPAFVAGKTLIYFDVCHCIEIRHVILRSPKAKPTYSSILERLQELRRQDKIICPMSCASFEELMKQDDPITRSATARVMDHLSGGICILQWIHLTGLEWEHHIAHTLLKLDREINPFTKLGFWAGEHILEYVALPEPDKTVREKLYVDRRWALSFAEHQAAPGFSKPPGALLEGFAMDGEARRNRQTVQPSTFADLARSRRRHLFLSLHADFFESLRRLHPVQSAEAAAAAINAVADPLIDQPIPWTVPSLQVFADIEAAATFHRRKIVENDLYDFLHAAEAIPYCDAFFCDAPLANLLRNKPPQLDLAYNTVIRSRPDEILEYLCGLA
jgi:hypothetical protein